MANRDPYAALRYKEFNVFLLVRFAMVFAWSMQFVIIEWEVYSLTKNPLSLGIIGLMEVIPAVSLALFAGHIVDQKEKKGLLLKCILGFSIISLGFFSVSRWYCKGIFRAHHIFVICIDRPQKSISQCRYLE